MSPAPAVELVHVSKTFTGKLPVTALADVNLRIQPRELLAIVGPSGSGKTTLLQVMGTLERPSQGTVSIAGAVTSSMTDTNLAGVRAWRIGFVFQDFHLIEHLNAVENVALGLMYRGIGPHDRLEAARHAIDMVGLEHRRHHRPAELSGGERQRVAIARAVVGSPSIVLADEPTGNLDSRSGAAVLELLLRLHDQGATIAVITHNAEVAKAMPRRLEIRDGRIEWDSAA
jgi:putative ABC transport system ATP-binding protein